MVEVVKQTSLNGEMQVSRPDGTRALRILMVAPQPFFRARGTPFSVLHRIRALLKLGHRVDLVTYPFGEDPVLDGLTIHRTKRPPAVRDVGIGPSLSKIMLDIPLFLEARRLLRSGQFDLLHTHEEAGAMGAWMSRKYGVPHLYDMHSSLPQQFGNFGRYNWAPVVSVFRALEEFTLNRSDGVIAICRDLEDHVKASGYDGPMAMIENTLDLARPAPDPLAVGKLRDRLGLGEADRVILYTGTFEPYQGLALLVRAIPQVVKEVPDARTVLVGGTERHIADLTEEIRAAGVEPFVTLVPQVAPEEVFLFHRLAEVLVTTRTRGTNTPLKIYQYLRAGLPIVATDIHSHTQVLSRDLAELVAPDAEDIARGIIRVLTDASHAESLAESARRAAEGRFSEQAYMDKLGALMRELPVGAASAGAPR